MNGDCVRLMRLLVQYQAVVDELVEELFEARNLALVLPVAPQRCDLERLLAAVERTVLQDYWVATGHHVQQTSTLLGLHRQTCYRRLRSLGVVVAQARPVRHGGGHPEGSLP